MKKKLFALAALVAALGSTAGTASAQDVLTGDTRLACEAILCLSSGTRPSECTPSLSRYFNITKRKLSDTIRARANFLQLCPVANQTPQMLAALMNWPQATFASKVSIAEGKAVLVREIDGGMETVEMALPAVVSADLRLNEPRYVTLPNIMKARKKPLEVITPATLGVDVAPRFKTLSVAEPPKRAAGAKVADVAELVAKLKSEGVLA